MFRKDRLRILDLGSGPGTAVLGTIDYFSQQDHRPFLEFIAQDQVAENLKEAARLSSNLQRGYDAVSTLTTIHSTIDKVEAGLDGKYDIIMLSNLLNELYAQDGGETVPDARSSWRICWRTFLRRTEPHLCRARAAGDIARPAFGTGRSPRAGVHGSTLPVSGKALSRAPEPEGLVPRGYTLGSAPADPCARQTDRPAQGRAQVLLSGAAPGRELALPRCMARRRSAW